MQRSPGCRCVATRGSRTCTYYAQSTVLRRVWCRGRGCGWPHLDELQQPRLDRRGALRLQPLGLGVQVAQPREAGLQLRRQQLRACRVTGAASPSTHQQRAAVLRLTCHSSSLKAFLHCSDGEAQILLHREENHTEWHNDGHRLTLDYNGGQQSTMLLHYWCRGMGARRTVNEVLEVRGHGSAGSSLCRPPPEQAGVTDSAACFALAEGPRSWTCARWGSYACVCCS